MMCQTKVSIKDRIAPSFYQLHRQVKRHDATHYWLKGGRGSTKSSFISIEIILGMMKETRRNAVVFRKVGGTLRESVYEQLIWAIDELGVADKWKARISPLSLSYGKQRIVFRGVDDPLKSKSIKLSHGYFAYIWFEELAEFPEMDTINTVLQSVMRGGTTFWCFYSYNPPESVQSWVNYEASLDRPDKIVHHSTYLTVPADWLGAPFIAEAEHMKAVNDEKYRHQYLGEVTGTGGEVFRNVTLRHITDEEIGLFDRIYRGLDWGYAADPLAYMVVQYDKTRKRLYIFRELYRVNMSNAKAAAYINQENPEKGLVICDSAEPKSIDDIEERGVHAEGAVKGPGSVERGIRFLKDEIEEIVIDPDRCPNAAREFTQYELEKDKLGNFKSVYPDKNNHTIDAVRYALERINDAPLFGW
ncbi:PBSX family phage terminase large subunit [uncultured Megasphaera sp.]|uniref:PBSX family phage terminase large subunit n=1 Tax=uncultured Megasphaera sp. TaxID=165188 RepID=UPI00265B622F|nr:PBSX family phage terminase large subunit [uncultured Megasphaera sp.]